MYHPHTQHNHHQQRPFSLYKSLSCRPRVRKRSAVFNSSVCRDNPILRRSDRHTTGLAGVTTYTGDELHPYDTFVEGFAVNPQQRLCGGSSCVTSNGGMFGRWTSKRSEGMVPVFKEDFQVLPDGRLALYHPRFVNKTAFVAFVLNTCPDCQDTKQMWQAYAIEGHTLVGGNGTLGDIVGTRVCTMKVQYLMFKRRDGELVDYVGPFNAPRLREMLYKVCTF